jgi:hypothetical protein
VGVKDTYACFGYINRAMSFEIGMGLRIKRVRSRCARIHDALRYVMNLSLAIDTLISTVF